MDAHLHDSIGNHVASVQVPSQRAYPPYIAYKGEVYHCCDVASPSGRYDLMGRVFIAEETPQSTT